MRNGHNPTRNQKELLSRNNKNWAEWFITKQIDKTCIFKNKMTGETLTLTDNRS